MSSLIRSSWFGISCSTRGNVFAWRIPRSPNCQLERQSTIISFWFTSMHELSMRERGTSRRCKAQRFLPSPLDGVPRRSANQQDGNLLIPGSRSAGPAGTGIRHRVGSFRQEPVSVATQCAMALVVEVLTLSARLYSSMVFRCCTTPPEPCLRASSSILVPRVRSRRSSPRANPQLEGRTWAPGAYRPRRFSKRAQHSRRSSRRC